MVRTSEGSVSPGSFRDPRGFVFQRGGRLLRQVNRAHREDYDHLMTSGLYERLTRDGLLVEHREVDPADAFSADAYKVIEPQALRFISYPYEWCFGQLKDAALATIRVQQRAMEFGMTLRDANAYNIQFHEGRPVLIDTLSFEHLPEGRPWVAYRQFCQHFLGPLALMSYRDVRLAQLLRVHMDGVPLDLVSSLLPFTSRLRPGLLLHLHLHGRSQRRRVGRTPARGFSARAFQGLVESLRAAVEGLRWRPEGSDWTGYYHEAESYTGAAAEHKRALVARFIDEVRPREVWDLGGNIGVFSRIAVGRGIFTVCFDADPGCVEVNYREAAASGERSILPLVLDLTNPSPRVGWQNLERMSLADRGPADLLLALALVHHLAIGNNVPLDRLARYFADLGRSLVIEFVPKSDPKVREMLAVREDVFDSHTQAGFERAFGELFRIERREPLEQSDRVMYLMRRRRGGEAAGKTAGRGGMRLSECFW